MYLARVIEPIVTPVQHPFFDRKTLLLVRRLEPDGRATGPDRVAVDAAQAGAGDLVLVLEEGNSARQIFDDPMAPVRSVVVGCVDAVELNGAIALEPGDAAPAAPRAAASRRRKKPRPDSDSRGPAGTTSP